MTDLDAKTHKDNLRSGTPFWIKTPHSAVQAEPHLSRDRFDVIVISAVARMLARA